MQTERFNTINDYCTAVRTKNSQVYFHSAPFGLNCKVLTNLLQNRYTSFPFTYFEPLLQSLQAKNRSLIDPTSLFHVLLLCQLFTYSLCGQNLSAFYYDLNVFVSNQLWQ